MTTPVFVTGNADKARYLSSLVGIELKHQKIDVDEIQSLDPREVIEHKAKQAYERISQPVIVEDTQLSFNALGRLPGTYIKWFIDEIGFDGLCRLLDSYDDRSAFAGAVIAYYDGSMLEIFEKNLPGLIAVEPQGASGFGWNRIFIPDGSENTLGEMDDAEFKQWYVKIKPITELAEFLAKMAT